MRTEDAGPSGSALSAGLGLAFPERDYLVWDPFDGERDAWAIREGLAA